MMTRKGICARGASMGDGDARIVEAIQRTIAYADLFDQAITANEIIRYLEVRASAARVMNLLQLHAGTLWHERRGYYCLRGHQALFDQTEQRARLAQVNWKRARGWASLMACLPFVRMIAVTGSLAMNNMSATDDIDYLVISERGRVWLTRLCLIAVVRLARPFGDKLCPNYVLSHAALLMADQSFHTARELAQMVPLFGLDVYEQVRAVNQWSLRYLPAAQNPPPRPAEIYLQWWMRTLKSMAEGLLRTRFGDCLEAWEMKRKIRRLQRMPGAQSPSVVLNAEQCKGHFRGTQRSVALQFEAILAQVLTQQP